MFPKAACDKPFCRDAIHFPKTTFKFSLKSPFLRPDEAITPMISPRESAGVPIVLAIYRARG